MNKQSTRKRKPKLERKNKKRGNVIGLEQNRLAKPEPMAHETRKSKTEEQILKKGPKPLQRNRCYKTMDTFFQRILKTS